MTRTIRSALSLMATSAVALTLGACKIDNRPLLARGGPPPADAGAPPLGPLDPGYAPPAYPTDAGPAPQRQLYAYPQRAYAMSRVVYQRPPSYAFAYGEEQPWVWDAADQGTMFAEPIDDGYRYYYYEPGEAYPYFVQDPDYGYAYGPDGVLIALFAATGALIAADHYRDYAPRAQGYWVRGYGLDQAYRRSPRYPVESALWRQRAPLLVANHDRWFRAASAQPAWRAAAGDNGRHLGWFKDHGDNGRHLGWDRGGGGGRGGEFAVGPAPHLRPDVRADHGRGRAAEEVRAAPHGPGPWREARNRPMAHQGPAFARPSEPRGHGGDRRGPPQAQAQPRPGPERGPGHGGGHGPGDRGQGHGGQAFARAEAHGPPGGGQGGGQHGGGGGGGKPHGEGGGQHGGGGGHGGGGEKPHGGGQGGHGGGGDHRGGKAGRH